MDYPSIKILPGKDQRLRGGSPWLYSNELKMDETARALAPGSIVRVMAPNGKIFGLAHFNPHTLIAARILTRNKDGTVDAKFLETRLARARDLRDRLYPEPYYRLIHAEADGLPGLVIDRFGETVVIQANTAGMAALEGPLVDALNRTLAPAVIIAKDETAARQLEGSPGGVRVLKGTPAAHTIVRENGLAYATEPQAGQKTGWYYDQRENRGFAARFAAGADVLDAYSYAGAFGLLAARAGAKSVTLVDGSETALNLARETAGREGLQADFEKADVFAYMPAQIEAKRRFGLVIADPPAFVKSKRDHQAGLRGYTKLARLSASLATEPGIVCLGCCSYHVTPEEFAAVTWAGIREAGRGGRLLHSAGAGPDHPIHPALPESGYLKFLVYALD